MLVWWGAEPSNQAVSLCMIVTDSRCQRFSVYVCTDIVACLLWVLLTVCNFWWSSWACGDDRIPKVSCTLSNHGWREGAGITWPALQQRKHSEGLARSLLLPLFVGEVVFVGAAFCTDDDGYHSPRKVWECQKTLVLVLR